jgi:hypothetical protein
MGGLAGGQGPRGCRDRVRPKEGTRLTAPHRRLPTGHSRDAAPVGCHPRRRAEPDGPPRASSEAGPGRRPGRWPQPPESSRSNRRLVLAPPLRRHAGHKTSCRPKKSCCQRLTSEVIATLGMSRALLRVGSMPLLGVPRCCTIICTCTT